jgi:hypothetical protein
METFTLVVWLSYANPNFGDGYREARTPGLTAEACNAAAKLVKYPQGSAHCVFEGRFEERPEHWPLPDRSPGAPPVICPFAPPRWRNLNRASGKVAPCHIL